MGSIKAKRELCHAGRTLIWLSILLGIGPGLLAKAIGASESLQAVSSPALILSLVSWVFGIASILRSKGYWGNHLLLGLLGIIGGFIALQLPDRYRILEENSNS